MRMMELTGPRLYLGPITKEDFVKVVFSAKPSVSKDDIVEHVAWTEKFG